MAENADPRDDEDDEKDAEGVSNADANEEPAAAEAAKAKPPKTLSASKTLTSKPAEASVVARGARPVAPQQTTQSLVKSMVLFVVVVLGLSGAFALLGVERGSSGARGANWKVGQTVDVEISLVAGDKRELSCAAADEVAGRHCAFEAPNKPWSKGDNTDDKKVLRPYTATDNVTQFLAAGVWSEPALAGTLPAARFSIKCKYTPEGKIKAPTFHWESGWEGQPRGEMLAGAVSGCTLIP